MAAVLFKERQEERATVNGSGFTLARPSPSVFPPHPLLSGLAIDHPRRLEYIRALENDERLMMAELRICQRNPYHYLTGWGFTLDEHAKAIRPWPVLPHHERTINRMFTRRNLVLPKSRQVGVSWDGSGVVLHGAQFNEGVRAGCQSKKGQDTGALLERMEFIWSHQPTFLRRNFPARFTHDKSGPKIRFRHNSEIMGFPEGPDQIRSYVMTLMWFDECQLNPSGAEGMAAAGPSLGLGKEEGGAMWATGTAHPGFWADIAYLQRQEALEQDLKGIEEYYGPGEEGGPVRLILQVHYSADPDKDPDTEKGRAWRDQEKAAFLALGNSEAKWKQEYEIDFEGCAGERFLPEFSRETHVLEEWDADPARPIIACTDYGDNTMVTTLSQYDRAGRFITFKEWVRSHVAFEDHDRDVMVYGRLMFGEQATIIHVGDPQADSHDAHSRETYHEMHLRIAGELDLPPGQRGPIFTKPASQLEHARLMRRVLAKRLDHLPGYYVVKTCPRLIQALLMLAYHPRSATDFNKDGLPSDVHPHKDLYDTQVFALNLTLGKNLRPLPRFAWDGADYAAKCQREDAAYNSRITSSWRDR